MANKGIIYSLQGLRIFAALIVICFHVVYIFEEKLGVFGYKILFNFGKSGVHLFFVLSGFVMYSVHKKDIGKGIAPGKSFAWKRFLRIYPTYWVLTTLVIIAMFFTSGEVKDYKYNFFYIFQSYSLLELGLAHGLPIIPPAWSLFHEIKFYLFFFLLIVIKNERSRLFLILTVLLLTLCNTIVPGSLGDNVYSKFYFNNLNLLFVLGILSAWITEKYYTFFSSVNYIWLSILSYLSIAVTCNIQSWPDNVYTDSLFGLTAFMVITAFSSYETYCSKRLNRNPFVIGKKGLYMADASYCLYLIHIPVYLIVFGINKRLGMPHIPFILVMLASAIATSLLYYKVVEYPLMNILRHGFYKRKTQPIFQ